MSISALPPSQAPLAAAIPLPSCFVPWGSLRIILFHVWAPVKFVRENPGKTMRIPLTSITPRCSPLSQHTVQWARYPSWIPIMECPCLVKTSALIFSFLICFSLDFGPVCCCARSALQWTQGWLCILYLFVFFFTLRLGLHSLQLPTSLNKNKRWCWASFHVFVSHLYVFFGEMSI